MHLDIGGITADVLPGLEYGVKHARGVIEHSIMKVNVCSRERLLYTNTQTKT